MSNELVMQQWDYWRKRIAEGDTTSAPRDWFESIIDSRDEQIDELTAQVEHMRLGFERIKTSTGSAAHHRIAEMALSAGKEG